MKKFITLVFFVGFLTSAFAQPDRHQQYGNQTNDNRSHSPEYSRDNNYGHSGSYPDNNRYDRNNQWNKDNHQNDYGYNKDRNGRNRDDMRRNPYDHPRYDKQKRNDDYPGRTRSRAPLLKIIFDIGIF